LRNSEFASDLQQFAESRIQEADDKVAPQVLCEDEERTYLRARKENFALAFEALKLLDLVGQDSDQLQTLNARVEEFYGDYYGALMRLSRSIAAESQIEDSGNPPANNYATDRSDSYALNRLFARHALRCRVAIRWVDHAWRLGLLYDARIALDLLNTAEEQDLKFCKRFLDDRGHDWDETARFITFEFLKSKVRLRLVQGEIEFELGMIPAARNHLEGKDGAKETREALLRWAIASHLKVPKAERVTERLKDALNRLHTANAGRTVGATASPNRTTGNLTASGEHESQEPGRAEAFWSTAATPVY
jgi:hypothetical protein